MIRKLAMAMVVSGALGSSFANALGLGEIKMNSALNQPLDAEVKLLNVGDLSKNEILPNLASHEDFARAGVERVFFLTGIKFDVELDGKGGATLHLTTDRIVREPFLNFLIELHWPNGRLLREYTALLDPPLFSEAPPAPVQQAGTTPVYNEPAAKPALAPAPTYTPTRDTAPAQAIVQPEPTPPSGKKDGTVRVKKNDTLWGIAKENRPDRSVTVRQTMLAIQQENPQAFINNNINLLKSGQVLRIPEAEVIRRIPSQQAYSEIARQNDAWSSKKTIDATQKLEQGDSGFAGTAEQGGMVKLLASDEDVVEDLPAQSASGEAADSEAVAEGQSAGDGDQVGEASSVSNVGELEKELQDLQRLVALKQEQLAILQTSQAEREAQAAAEAGIAASAVLEGEAENVAEVGPVASEEGSQVSEDVVTVGEAEEAEAAAQLEAAKAQEKRPEQGILDILINNPLYIGILLVVLLGALILLGAISRRRKEDKEYSPEPTSAEADGFDEEVDLPDDLDEVLAEQEPIADGVEETESEVVAAVEDVAEGDETRKLLEEADIYIAYGRYERATEILQPAVNDHPKNTELRLKLAEIALANNEQSRFAQQEMDLQALGDTAALASLEELKAKYGSASEDSESLVDEPETVEESLVEDVEEEVPASETEELEDLEFELPEEAEPESDVAEASEEEVAHENLVDFDMGSESAEEEDDFLDIDADVSEVAEEDDNVLEFSLDEEPETSVEEETSSADDMDFLVDTDESATKLELAKAYIDMADTEAAQDILNEVISEGSDPQKEEARKLLENLE